MFMKCQRVFYDDHLGKHITYPILVNLDRVRWVYETALSVGNVKTCALVMQDDYRCDDPESFGLIVIGPLDKLITRIAKNRRP